jgi:glycosyltransferase involved in cell wall biosynthesis
VSGGAGAAPATPRIAVNASVLGARPTGLGTYTANLVEALDRAGEPLAVYTSMPESLSPGSARIRRVPAFTRPERTPAGHFFRLLWLQTAFPARLLAERPRVVLNTVPEGMLLPVAPQVTVVHDLLPLYFPADYPRQQQYFRRLVPAVLRASRLIVSDSESTRRDIVGFYGIAPERVRVVPAGYDESVFHPERPAGPAAGDPYVLFVGNLFPHKNLLRLLDAFALLTRRVRARLLVRGEGNPAHTAEIHERVATLGLGGRVVFVPYAGPDELRRLYCRALVLALPSRYEGFGLTALEAMACATPVVAAAAASLPEVVGSAALLVDPDDTLDLAEALHRVFTDADLREHLRQQGPKQAARFSWRRTAEQILEVLGEAAGGAP